MSDLSGIHLWKRPSVFTGIPKKLIMEWGTMSHATLFRIAGLSIAILGLGGLFQNCSQTSSIDVQSKFVSAPPLNSPVDPLVCNSGSTTTAINSYPSACLIDPKLPADSVGFESNENYSLVTGGASNIYSLNSNNPALGTPTNSVLYIEFATYLAPDTVVITAENINGKTTTLFNVCNVATYSTGDPSGGTQRPYSDTIQQFSVILPWGTTKLNFDFTNALSPTYLGVWNLNEFSTDLFNPAKNPFASTTTPNYFRAQTSPLVIYNDNADPGAGANTSCSN